VAPEEVAALQTNGNAWLAGLQVRWPAIFNGCLTVLRRASSRMHLAHRLNRHCSHKLRTLVVARKWVTLIVNVLLPGW
jgi:hypothetical protein